MFPKKAWKKFVGGPFAKVPYHPPPPAPAPHPRHLQPGTDALRRPPSSTARARHPRHPRLQDGPPARTGCLQARLPAWAGCLPGQAACKGRLPARAGWLQGRAACRDRRRPAHPSTLGARRPRHPRLQDWLAERAACKGGLPAMTGCLPGQLAPRAPVDTRGAHGAPAPGGGASPTPLQTSHSGEALKNGAGGERRPSSPGPAPGPPGPPKPARIDTFNRFAPVPE